MDKIPYKKIKLIPCCFFTTLKERDLYITSHTFHLKYKFIKKNDSIIFYFRIVSKDKYENHKENTMCCFKIIFDRDNNHTNIDNIIDENIIDENIKHLIDNISTIHIKTVDKFILHKDLSIKDRTYLDGDNGIGFYLIIIIKSIQVNFYSYSKYKQYYGLIPYNKFKNLQ